MEFPRAAFFCFLFWDPLMPLCLETPSSLDWEVAPGWWLGALPALAIENRLPPAAPSWITCEDDDEKKEDKAADTDDDADDDDDIDDGSDPVSVESLPPLEDFDEEDFDDDFDDDFEEDFEEEIEKELDGEIGDSGNSVDDSDDE
jgi:hypothetical protein